MVRHVVMWKLKEQAEGNSKSVNAQKIKKMVENLIEVIPGIINIEVNFNHEDASISNWDVVLISDHMSFDDLNMYQVHPEHQKVGAFVKSVVDSRACVDYEF